MQAIKEKLSDMSQTRKVKAEARADEKAEKEYAKARVGVAHEVRLAKEAEAEMDKHVTKAERLAQKELEKHGVADGPRSNSDPGATDPIGAGASPKQPVSAPTFQDLV